MKRFFMVLLCFTWVVSASILAANPFLAKPADKNSTDPELAVEAPAEKKINELLELLGEEEVQDWLRKQLEKKEPDAAAKAHSELSPQDWITIRLAALEDNITALRMATTEVPAQFEDFKKNWVNELGDGDTLRSLVYVVVFLIIGFGIEWLYWCYTSGIRRRLTLSGDAPMLIQLAKYSLLKALGIAFFALGAIGSFIAFSWKPLVELLVITLLMAIVISRVLQLVIYFLLNPHETDQRPLPLSAKSARHLYWWGMVINVAAVFGFFLAFALGEMGFAPGVALLLKDLVAMIIAVLLIGVVWDWYFIFNRYEVNESTDYPDLAHVSQIVPAIATLIILVELFLWVIGARILTWSLLLIVLVLVFDKGSRLVIRSTIKQADAFESEQDNLLISTESPGNETVPDQQDQLADGIQRDVTVPKQLRRGLLYRPVLERLVRFILVITAVIFLGNVWGFDVFELSESSSISGRLFGAAVDIIVAYLIADLFWVWGKTAIDLRMADYVPPIPGRAPGPEARLVTLLPLLRKILIVTLVSMVVLVGLSSAGVNIGPLLAGAGVVGIAIGFGAQALVKDIVSGIFFLIDDAFRVGEYIEIGTLRGTVESISIRSIRVRHHRGAVHTIPFGEMTSLTNYSRDWVIMKLEFRVPFNTDLKLVKKIVKDVGKGIQADPEIGPSFLEPLKSQGVRRMEEFNMVVGVKFKAKPGEQWSIRKLAYQRIRDAFNANGLGFAERNVKVEVIGAGEITPEVKEAATGAAQIAIDKQMPLSIPKDEP